VSFLHKLPVWGLCVKELSLLARVRQIEVGAFAKVQSAVKHRVAAIATPEPLQVR